MPIVNKRKAFKVFKGGTIVFIGTINDIAEALGVKRSTVLQIKSPGHQRRYRKPTYTFEEIGWVDSDEDGFSIDDLNDDIFTGGYQ